MNRAETWKVSVLKNPLEPALSSVSSILFVHELNGEIMLTLQRCMQYVFKINKLRMMPVNTAVFLRSFMTMLGKQILARAVGIRKENWG